MISEYSKARIKTTGRVGIIVEFDNREGDAIHLIELTDTDAAIELRGRMPATWRNSTQ